MSNLNVVSSPYVEAVFSNYPDFVKSKILKLREFILETAKETDGINTIEETLKWGEPSYLNKLGSTIRIDWKTKSPDQYAMYFKCTSKLVETFKLVFQDTFEYENNRAIVFSMEDTIPETELKKCIKAALTYHKVKSLPNLGII